MPAVFKDSVLLRGRADGCAYYRENASEPYVEIPPAYIITESNGATWTLGSEYLQRGWIFEFNVLRNDIDTGEMASKIVYRGGKVRIFGVDGWRVWTGKSFI
jgi:hypothetical protein